VRRHPSLRTMDRPERPEGAASATSSAVMAWTWQAARRRWSAPGRPDECRAAVCRDALA
jgi:hypothetical protein